MSFFALCWSLLDGLAVTLLLTAGGSLVAIGLAWIAGLGRLSTHRVVRATAAVYVEVFRGTSALVQLYWFFYALPLLGVHLSPLVTGVVVLGLNIGAYGAEVVRGAIVSIGSDQREAAVALNMTRRQQLWLVIVPQALLRMLPPAGNLLIELMKATALVSLITLSDLTFRGMILRAETLDTVQVFGLLLLIYFGIGQALIVGVRALERRVAGRWHMGRAT
ncbi:MAG: ectoine/hydroxyectoine ABC transporter permease subunit EhuC [Candidatus Hydrogenedentes bacterium]|nr:ectoine/hydroxyectoine ABC transporter permease subunit EhuC [Candidatus Hydrogenedentota bacterium]